MNKNLPEFQSYGQYASANYGVNTITLLLPGLTLYYSYQTIIAYWDNVDGKVISENVWSVTTGKHLNWIDRNKENRVNYEKFQEMLQSTINRHFK